VRPTLIWFEVIGVLVDPVRIRRRMPSAIAAVMAERWGGRQQRWAAAYQAIRADWDSYYADLDLRGDEGVADLWEGCFRTTRALFRRAGVPEPAHDVLIAFARELPGLAARRCQALYPEAIDVVQRLHAEGIRLGVLTHVPGAAARGYLVAGGIASCFQAPVLGMDDRGQFDKDYAAALRGVDERLPRAAVLIVESDAAAACAARAAGWLARGIRPAKAGHDLRALLTDLAEQPEQLEQFGRGEVVLRVDRAAAIRPIDGQ
jgi:phosphoglycolate phosphatase-like HAD superfamily hydrolase